MNKFQKSWLLTGLLAVGVAACGDDVTITPPPPPPDPAIRSVSVAPDNITVAPGQTVQMSVSITADAGCNPATTWSSSDATRATVTSAGVVTVLATASSGPVAIRAAVACATGSATGGAAATLNVQAATITGVTTSPSGNVTLPADPNARLTATATVSGTGSFNAGVDWSVSNTGIVTLSCTTACPANNNVDIIPVSGASGTAQVRATSKGDATKSAVISVTVIPATVTIQSITTGGLTNPVDLTNVNGQIEIALNVDPGAAPNVAKVQAVIGTDVVAEQIFGSAGPAAAPSAAPQTIVLNTNTRQVRKANSLFVPVIRNGNNTISARVFLTNTSNPIVSNAIPVRMNNADAVFVPTNLKASDPSTAVQLGSGTWYTGSLETDGVNFVAFDTLPPNSMGIGVCGTGTATATGTWNTGMAVKVVYPCATTQGSASVAGGPGPVGYATAIGPDGTNPQGPTAYSGVTSKYVVNGDDRWNLIPGTFIASSIPSVLVDNVAPSVTPDEIGFYATPSPSACEGSIPTPGCWINAAYNIAGDFPALDGSGSGVKTTEVFDLVSVGTGNPDVCGAVAYTAGLVEDPSPTKYASCAVVKDSVGNATSIAGFNLFGYDNTAPVTTYTGTYVSGGAGDSAYVAVVPATNLNFTAQDNNSGLDAALSGSLGEDHTLADAAPACTIPSAALTGSGTAPLSLAAAYGPDGGCGDQGVYRWSFTATDRAGNSSAPIGKVFGLDRTIPEVQTLAPQPLYGGGSAANFLLFATDSVDLASARVGIGYNGTDGNSYEIGYRFTSGFGQQWDHVLTNVTTPSTGFPMQLAGTQVLAGLVVDTTVAVGGAPDGFTYLVASATDFLPSTSAPFTINPLPPVYKDAAKFSTSATVWSNPALGTAAGFVSPTSSSCAFNYNTPTNGPTIPTRVLVLDETAPGIMDLLLEITTSGNGLGANDNPKLLSDNGVQRQYQYRVSSTVDCATLQTGTLRLIAVKNDANLLPVGYLVP